MNSRRGKTNFRTDKEDILMRAIVRDTEKVSQEVVKIDQSSGIESFTWEKKQQ